MDYDIIGDIHGQYDKLVGLLRHLGYRQTMGRWAHPDRQAIFVGDLIDRGPGQIRSVDLVRRMVDSGTALCVLGNHEFNAIAWATADPARPGHFLRAHDRPGNREQHAAFLVEVEGRPEHAELIGWFKTLPLWLELPGLRVVHACWNDQYQRELLPQLGAGHTVTDELMVLASRQGHWAYSAVEALCKGLEVTLPEGYSFPDKGGKVRRQVRIRWWRESFGTYRDEALVSDDVAHHLPELPMPADPRVRPYAGPPVFVGHYWRTGTPSVFSPSVACVDYSAGKGGPLVAYRWQGESVLTDAGFVVA